MATKKQELEREALEQIKKIIAGLGEGSNVGAAFEGCFEMAENNIWGNFCCSMKERLENAEAAKDSLSRQLDVVTKERNFNEKLLKSAQEKFERMHEAWEHVSADLKVEKQNTAQERAMYQQLKDDYEQVQYEKFKAENHAGVVESENVFLKDEIIRLKAKLYDLLIK